MWLHLWIYLNYDIIENVEDWLQQKSNVSWHETADIIWYTLSTGRWRRYALRGGIVVQNSADQFWGPSIAPKTWIFWNRIEFDLHWGSPKSSSSWHTWNVQCRSVYLWLLLAKYKKNNNFEVILETIILFLTVALKYLNCPTFSTRY